MDSKDTDATSFSTDLYWERVYPYVFLFYVIGNVCQVVLYNFVQTRAVRGSDYSPAIELSEQKDKLVTENWRD